MAANQKFFEIIKPGINLEFIGNQKYWIGASITLLLVTFLMLPINAYVIKGRGHMLNWGVEFRGGTEIVVDFAKPVTNFKHRLQNKLLDIIVMKGDTGEVRAAA